MSTPERDGAVEDRAPRAPGRRRTALLVVLVVALVAAAALVFSITRDDDHQTAEPQRSEEESTESTETTESTESASETTPAALTLLELDGSGDETSEVFEAALNWELRWKAPDAESFSVELFNEEGESRGVLIEDSEDPDGSTFVSEAGSFYLEVTSDGDWSISVIGPPPE